MCLKRLQLMALPLVKVQEGSLIPLGMFFVGEVSFRQVTIFVSLKRAFYHPFHKMDKLFSPKLDCLFIKDFTMCTIRQPKETCG